MMTWITENPFWLCATGVFLGIIFLILYFSTQNNKFMILAGLSVVLIVGSFTIERVIVTERETITSLVHQLARHVRENDMEAILEKIPEDKKECRQDVEFLMPKCEFTGCRVNSRPEFRVLTDRQAEIEFNVFASVKFSTEGAGSSPVRIKLVLEKRGGEWKIIEYGYRLPKQTEWRKR